MRAVDPEVVFLSEAFTRPPMMAALAKAGFSQSYTYFTWKNTKAELIEYMTQLTRSTLPEFFRPNFFANTPDILHEYLQRGGRPAFEARLVLAATLSPSYGIYSGYEHFENVPVREGSEEYLDSEKYEVKKRKLDGPLLPLAKRLNAIRRENAALQRLDNVDFLETENEQLIAYVKRSEGNVVIVCVNLDPRAEHEGVVTVPVWLGLPPAYSATELLSETEFHWRIGRNYVRLGPGQSHVLRVETIQMSEQGHWFESDPHWFKRAVFYEIHIRGFFDGNDDGAGDFRGLIEKLDYLQWLGIDCIWLLPMYSSPLKDGGYDIADFFTIHQDYGTVDDFKAFVDAAHQRGMRVIADLVMNHTSADHPWFQESRSSPDSTRSATGTCGPTPTSATSTRGSSSSTPSPRTGRGTRSPGSTTGTASSRTSRI